MKRVRVLIPFIVGETGKLLKAGKVTTLSEDVIARALAINPNMLEVLGDVKTKEEHTEEQPTEQTEEQVTE